MAFEKDNIIAQLKDASITDLNDLVKAIEDEFDVSASAPVAAAGAAGAAAAKSTFDVELTSAGAGKIKVIKELKGKCHEEEIYIRALGSCSRRTVSYSAYIHRNSERMDWICTAY